MSRRVKAIHFAISLSFQVEVDSVEAIRDDSNSTAPLLDENGLPITEGESEEERQEKEQKQRKMTAEWVAKMISSGEMVNVLAILQLTCYKYSAYT